MNGTTPGPGSEHPTLEQLSELVEDPGAAPPGLASHVGQCETCSTYVALLRRMDEELASLPPLPAPAGELDRVLARLGEEHVLERRPRETWKKGVREWFSIDLGPPRALAAAAVLLLAFAGGWWMGREPAGSPLADAETLVALVRLEALLPPAPIGPEDEERMAARAVHLGALADASREALVSDTERPAVEAFLLRVQEDREALLRRLPTEPALVLGPDRVRQIREDVQTEARLAFATLTDTPWRGLRGLAPALPGEGPWWEAPVVAGGRLEPLTDELAAALNLSPDGLLVLRVADGTPLARLGIVPGDVLVRADGALLRTVSDLRSRLDTARESGTPLLLEWLREGEPGVGELEP